MEICDLRSTGYEHLLQNHGTLVWPGIESLEGGQVQKIGVVVLVAQCKVHMGPGNRCIMYTGSVLGQRKSFFTSFFFFFSGDQGEIFFTHQLHAFNLM